MCQKMGRLSMPRLIPRPLQRENKMAAVCGTQLCLRWPALDVSRSGLPDTTTGQPHSPLNRYSVHLLWGPHWGGTRRVGRSHAGEDANHKMAAGITVSTAALVDQCQHVLQAVRDGHALCVGAGKPPGGEAEGAHAPRPQGAPVGVLGRLLAGPAGTGPGQVLCEDGARRIPAEHPHRTQQRGVLTEVVTNLLQETPNAQGKWNSLRGSSRPS